MDLIIPTVGRKVYYYADESQAAPIDATIIKVHGTPASSTPYTSVNLRVTDPDTAVSRLEASVQAGDEHTDGRHYRWMKYQLGQAAKQSTSAPT